MKEPKAPSLTIRVNRREFAKLKDEIREMKNMFENVNYGEPDNVQQRPAYLVGYAQAQTRIWLETLERMK